MPHVLTTRHDLLINHVFTIPFIPIVPKYCSHCYGHCTCEEMALYISSMQTFSKSEPFWPAASACLAQFRTPCCPDEEGVSLLDVQLVRLFSLCFLQVCMDRGCVSLDDQTDVTIFIK